jgi:transposase
VEPIFVREPNKKERDRLYELMEDRRIGYRAKIIILSYEGYTPPQIEKAIHMHVKNIRKWIKRFNEFGIKGILEKRRPGRKPKLSEKLVKEIINIVGRSPHELGLPFSTWSLRKLESYLKQKGVRVSHTRIRQLLLNHGFRFWKSRQELISRPRIRSQNA